MPTPASNLDALRIENRHGAAELLYNHLLLPN